MQPLSFSLFGKIAITYDDYPVEGCDASKVRELLSYLLINRNRPHSREVIASLLWGDYCTTAQSKKYLRKALWQLQSALSRYDGVLESGLLQVDTEWIELQSVEGVSIDVERLENLYDSVKGVDDREISMEQAARITEIESVYVGRLLESWYQEWCLCERERLHLMYLTLLEKLMAYHEVHGAYLEGLEYGLKILNFDKAREFTHRQIMRLYYLAGKRTDALYQYQKCKSALKEELDVMPSRKTEVLYEAIRDDRPIVEPGKIPDIPVQDDIAQAIKEVESGMIGLQTRLNKILVSLSKPISRDPGKRVELHFPAMPANKESNPVFPLRQKKNASRDVVRTIRDTPEMYPLLK